MREVYVHAWEYATGGGFDWYQKEEAARIAYEKDKEVTFDLREEEYVSYFSVHQVPCDLSAEDTTTAIMNVIHSDEYTPMASRQYWVKEATI